MRAEPAAIGKHRRHRTMPVVTEDPRSEPPPGWGPMSEPEGAATEPTARKTGRLEPIDPEAPERVRSPGDGDGEDAAFADKVIRSFIRDGRLVSIPARERRRRVVYRYLRDAVFTEDCAYPEKEVNMRLALFHRDVATIRRGMVDAGLVTREAGEYRRGRD